MIPALTGWPDQGQVTDVMVHIGSLLAILVYFWRDVIKLARGGIELLKGRMTDGGRLALYILLGTIPAVVFGVFLKLSGFSDLSRNVAVVAWNTILYGLLMLIADRVGPMVKSVENMSASNAFIIGVAQALALIPGTSRSGVTMTAARYLGYARPDAARFSFLLGIPATAAAAIFTVGEAFEGGRGIAMDDLLAAAFTFLSALAAIAFLMAVLKRVSFLPFVIYRIALGGFLLVMIYT